MSAELGRIFINRFAIKKNTYNDFRIRTVHLFPSCQFQNDTVRATISLVLLQPLLFRSPGKTADKPVYTQSVSGQKTENDLQHQNLTYYVALLAKIQTCLH